MKKLPAIIALALTLSLLLCSAASADVITPIATEINLEHLEKVACHARILGYNAETNTLTVELIVPERFSREEVAALKEGDGIYTKDQEVLIESINYDDEWCSTVFFNGWDIMMFQERDGNYTMMADEDDCVWISLGMIECPVQDSLLCLDYIDEKTRNALPDVHTARELTARLLEEGTDEPYTVGLSINNVYVVFDGEGNLAAIHRYWVLW